MPILLFLVGWIFAFVTAIIPFIFGILVVNQFKIFHWLYFIGGGALTAAALCSLYISIPNLGINVQEPEPSFWQEYLSALPTFLACGSIAGMACWKYLRRKFTP
jgi:hypothetical protein